MRIEQNRTPHSENFTVVQEHIGEKSVRLGAGIAQWLERRTRD